MTNETPKKTKFVQYFFIIVASVFTLFGIDHYTTNLVSGGATITLTDSTLVVSPMVDTIKCDTIKKDTVIGKIK